jgi:hypothetical protein
MFCWNNLVNVEALSRSRCTRGHQQLYFGVSKERASAWGRCTCMVMTQLEISIAVITWWGVGTRYLGNLLHVSANR